MAIYSFFPRAMGIYNLGRQLTKGELNFINKQKKISNVGNQTSFDRNILDNKSLSKLREFIDLSVRDYFYSVYQPSTNVHPYITQSWASYTGKTQYHHRHNHRNSFISGVFYVSALKDVDHIVFVRNEPALFFFEPKNLNDYNADFYPIMVEKGLLILFPSYTEHLVPIVEHDHDRISIAFNVFLKGPIGNKENMCFIEV